MRGPQPLIDGVGSHAPQSEWGRGATHPLGQLESGATRDGSRTGRGGRSRSAATQRVGGLVLLEFPSREAFEGFYRSAAYQDLHALRDEVSYAWMVAWRGCP